MNDRASDPPLVSLSGVSKQYRVGREPVAALKQVDFELKQGQMTAITGPSGSGKSTLLHLIGCLDRPTSGLVNLFGQDVLRLKDTARARLRNSRIGMVFQNFHLLPRFTARENVKLPLVYQPGAKDIDHKATLALERVGLAHRAHHRPSQLSGGECQRVAIARAIVNSPELLLCDEPTGNLDRKTGRSIIELFMQLNQTAGIAVMIVTHDPQTASGCSRLVEIEDGRICNRREDA